MKTGILLVFAVGVATSGCDTYHALTGRDRQNLDWERQQRMEERREWEAQQKAWADEREAWKKEREAEAVARQQRDAERDAENRMNYCLSNYSIALAECNAWYGNAPDNENTRQLKASCVRARGFPMGKETCNQTN